MQTFTTPMMKQYMDIKSQYPDCLLLYRMGDFYELFLDDALIGAQILNITLTSRHKGKDGKIPMAGVPYHAIDNYLTKLVQAGYKVAICEQLSPPNKYGLVERDVVRTVTPGTMLNEHALNQKDNNYIISLTMENNEVAITIADLSTGYFAATQIPFKNLHQIFTNEFSYLRARECILPEHIYNNPEILKVLRLENKLNIYCFPEWSLYADSAHEILKKHFGVSTLEGFQMNRHPLTLQSSAALLGYFQQTQKSKLTHIKKIVSLATDNHLAMDRSTIINLELFSTIREHDTTGSLYEIIDHTSTAMGGRLLRQWLMKPLIDKAAITQRLDCVEYFLQNTQIKDVIQNKLTQIRDIERISSKLSVSLGNARDLINLKNSLSLILEVKQLLTNHEIALIKTSYQHISPQIKLVIELIEKSIAEEPPVVLKEGGLMQLGIHPELDQLRSIVANNKQWLLQLEQQERQRTGIASLKIRFNQVFGFYIEISKANLHLIPSNYFRKQTLVNSERFITPELTEHEEIILSAEEKINALEYELFNNVLNEVLQHVDSLQQAAEAIATIDCLINFAYLAEKQQYIRPIMTETGEIKITEGRHPVVETLLDDRKFVPNDTYLDNNTQQLLLITGPNMAGKSVLIRQVALIVLMAQIGSFIPASKAEISIVDKIFVRSGASDVITSGLSTFMVEMVETAYILHNTTQNSLIIMDEIGRGTSTYDGISIAWAVAEYLVTSTMQPKTLFATHYHELQALQDKHPNQIKNYQMAIEEENGQPIFLHTLIPGGASHSFGIAVAKLAGIPQSVITKAFEVLGNLENRNSPSLKTNYQISSQDIFERLLYKELECIDLSQTTPLEALNLLAQLKDQLRLFHKETTQYLEAD